MKTDYIDGLLLHNPDLSVLHGSQGHYEVMEKLKKQGKIRAYGASVDSSRELNILMDKSQSRIAEVLFNAFNQEAAQAFHRAGESGLGLIIKVPLDSGWLSGKYKADSVFTTGHRDRWTREVKKRRAKLVDQISFLSREDQNMAQGALRFNLSYPQVSTVIAGTKNRTQLEDNLKASDKSLNPEDVKKIQNLWIQNVRENPLPW